MFSVFSEAAYYNWLRTYTSRSDHMTRRMWSLGFHCHKYNHWRTRVRLRHISVMSVENSAESLLVYQVLQKLHVIITVYILGMFYLWLCDVKFLPQENTRTRYEYYNHELIIYVPMRPWLLNVHAGTATTKLAETTENTEISTQRTSEFRSHTLSFVCRV
jgi:hypothetical protein